MKSNALHNKPLLISLCQELDFEYYEINEHQIRIMGATHIIDIWPARMTYHRISGEDIKSKEDYSKLDYVFNKEQVSRLLYTGSKKQHIKLNGFPGAPMRNT